MTVKKETENDIEPYNSISCFLTEKKKYQNVFLNSSKTKLACCQMPKHLYSLVKNWAFLSWPPKSQGPTQIHKLEFVVFPQSLKSGNKVQSV